MTRYTLRSSPLLFGLALLATAAHLTAAQDTFGIPGLFEVNASDVEDVVGNFFGEFFGDDDAEGDDGSTWDLENITGIDFEALFTELSDYIGESLDNFTLPPELAELFELPTFDNFEFSFGGNCTLCDDHTVPLEGSIESLSCHDWDLVATLGIVDGTTQCDLLRVVAAEYCGCPVPDVNAGRTCPICPTGEEPGAESGLNDTLGVSCFDLLQAPAVDGNKTCNTVADVAAQCACQIITSFESLPDGAEISGAARNQNWRLSSLAVLALGSLGFLLI